MLDLVAKVTTKLVPNALEKCSAHLTPPVGIFPTNLSPSGIAATILYCHEPLERLGEASHVGADLVDVVAEADDVGLERAPVQSQEVQLRAGKDESVPEMI